MMSNRTRGYGRSGLATCMLSLALFLAFCGVAVAAPQYELTCDDCHRMPPLDSALGNREPSTGAFKGNHETHAGTTAETCVKCHGVAVVDYPTGHRTKQIQVNGNINSSPKGATYSRTFFNQTSIPPASLGTCSNVNCHFETATLAWGTKLSTTCTSCHSDSPSSGRHAKHLTVYGGASACEKCHPNHNGEARPFAHASSASHRGISVTFSAAPNSGGTYSGDGLNFLPSEGKVTFGNCSNLYCHSDGTRTTAPFSGKVAASWTGSLGCNGCHGGPAALTTDILATGSHTAHINNAATLGTNFGCTECHAKTVTIDTAISGPTYHVNKFVDYSGVRAGKPSTYSGSSCSATYCHTSGKKGLAGMAATVEPGNPTWGGSTIDCKGCHGAKSLGTAGVAFTSVAGEPNYENGGAGQPNANSHQKHVKTTGASTCVYCHSGTTADGTTIAGGHTNGSIDVLNGGGKTFGYPGNSTCSNVSCHTSGGKFSAADVQWGAQLDCKGCHATLSGAHTRHMGGLTWAALPFYNYTANLSSGSDTDGVTWKSYAFGCANCHPVATAKHLDGFVDVEMNTIAGGSTLRNRNSTAGTSGTIGAGDIRCSNVYCHANTLTPQWNQTFTAAARCSGCHGNAPAGDSHAAHAVAIHYDRIYSGTTGKLAASGAVGVNAGHGDPAQSTTIGCNSCHASTVSDPRNKYNASCSSVSCHGNATGSNADATGAARITGLASHVNGSKDVVFPSVVMKSKAQILPESFSNYTGGTGGWTASGRNFKTGSNAFDTAKYPLSSGTFNAGTCSNISCHNGNDAHWTGDLGNGVKCLMCHKRL